MDYLFENFTFPPDQSFTIRSEYIEPKMNSHFRCHLNFEITLIENASGKRFIGDHIEDFSGPDLVLIGSYTPHCWQFYNEQSGETPAVITEPSNSSSFPHAYVIHFFPDFLGKEWLNKPEASLLCHLFDNAAKGIHFSGPTVAQARVLIQHMLFAKGLQRIALMLQLLDVLSQSKHQKMLATPGFCSVANSRDADRINCVYDYIFQNFREEIVLPKVASLLHMTPAAFCRYFKLKTNRTLIDFVKEIRIGYASKLLIDGRHNITEACYNSGHNNLSNFNKHFKELKGITPRDFLKQYQQALA